VHPKHKNRPPKIYKQMYTHTPSVSIPLSHSTSSLQIALHITLQAPLRPLRNPIPKANSNSDHKRETKERRTPLVVIADRNTPLDLVDAPQVNSHRIEQCQTGDESESPSRSERDAVAEVEERRCDGAEDDGEFELEDVVSLWEFSK
jgi:hypothetical protein